MDVEDWNHQCMTYAATTHKMPQIQLQGKFHEYNARQSFERIAVDLTEPFAMPCRRNQYNILVVADYFSKWCATYPVPTTDAPEIAKVIVENWILY